MPCTIVAAPATIRTSPTARSSCRSSRLPVNLAPRIAPGTDVAAPTASSDQSTPFGRWPKTPAIPRKKPTAALVPTARNGSAPKRRSAGSLKAPRMRPTKPPSSPITAPVQIAARTLTRSEAVRCSLRCGRRRSIPKTRRVRPITISSALPGTTPDRRPPITAPTIDGGAIHANSRQSIRPPPNVGDRRCERRNRRDTDVRAGPRRRARGRYDEHGESDVPEDEAHETAHQRGREAPEPDEDEDESVQALEYPL